MSDGGERLDQPMFWEPSISFLRLTVKVIVTASLFFIAAILAFAPEQHRRVVGPCVMAVVAGTAWFLLSRGRIKASVVLLVVGIWSVATATSLLNGGVRAPVVMIYPQIILMTGWLLGPRKAFFGALLTIATTLGFVVAETGGYLGAAPPTPPVLHWIVQSAIFATSALIITFLVRSYRKRVADVERLGVELAERASVLAGKEGELRLVAESVPAMIFHGDAEQRCLYVNRSCAELFASSPADLSGKPVREMVGEENYAEWGDRIQRVLGKERVAFRASLYTARRDERTFDIDLVPELSPDGKANGFFAVMKDVTEQAQAEDALVALNEELEQRVDQRTFQLLAAKNEAEKASAAKSEFLSRMSHELRTPLNAILGFSQLLEIDPVLTEAQASNVKEISHAGNHLLALINEVLDLSRIESGRLDLDLESVGLDELVDDCVPLIVPSAAKRRIEVKRQGAVVGVVRADRLRLRQVFLNLLSNAVKYNREGGSITVGVIADDGAPIRIFVRDTGRGIARESLAKLFQPFERLTAFQQGIEGTGIGLAISMRLVEAMGGTIEVDSELGVGSTFWIELPRGDSPKSSGPPRAALPSTASALETSTLDMK